jgi:hypothetical protein
LVAILNNSKVGYFFVEAIMFLARPTRKEVYNKMRKKRRKKVERGRQ